TGTTVGSVLSLLEQVKSTNECASYVICMNSKYQSVFLKSKFVDFCHTMCYKNEEGFFLGFQNWFASVNFEVPPIIYFTTDSSCYLVNKYREWFDSNCILCL